MRISWFWSRGFLLDIKLLWLIFITNALGTVYGYMWYAGQLELTWHTMPKWLVLFVPDSPTASLFFTLAVAYLLFDHHLKLIQGSLARAIRAFIEAFAVITSIKYGIWAVIMIFAGYFQGDALVWQDWMLVVSHLGMALEALLFARFFTYRVPAILLVAIWTFSNDIIDYSKEVFPMLPAVLHDDLPWIEKLTMGLSCLGILCAWLALPFRQTK